LDLIYGTAYKNRLIGSDNYLKGNFEVSWKTFSWG